MKSSGTRHHAVSLILAVPLVMAVLSLASCVPYTYVAGTRRLAPLVIGESYSRFDDMIASVISANGGLPGQDAQVLRLDIREGDASPILEWTLHEIEMRNTGPLFADDDVRCLLALGMSVVYADGTSAELQWRTSSYGYHLGPLYVATGSGPPWDVRVAAHL